jgi:hypothetical protein
LHEALSCYHFHHNVELLLLPSYSTSSCLVTKLWIHGMYICMYVCTCLEVSLWFRNVCGRILGLRRVSVPTWELEKGYWYYSDCND